MSVNDVIVKSFQIVQVFFARERLSASITSGRCESRKLYGNVLNLHGIGNFRNDKIFGNVDAGEGLTPLNQPKSFAGAISMPAAPRPGWGPGPPRRRIEITPAIYFLENYNCNRKFCTTFVGFYVLCSSV